MTKRDPLAGEALGGQFGLAPMSTGDFRQIHLATLEVLERTGLFIEDQKALDLYADGGCAVDRETRVIKMPPRVVEGAIAAAPERISLYSRARPEHDVIVDEADRVRG